MKLSDEAVETLKEDFPLLQKKLIYLDNAATSQKPGVVIDAMTHYYSNSNANIHRGVYALSEEATKIYEDARAAIAKFIGARPVEIIFTKNATEAINLVSHSIEPLLKGPIVLSELEHHSNIVPWQGLGKRIGKEIRFIGLDKFRLDMKDAESKIQDAGLLSVAHVSNALGTINDVRRLTALAKSVGAYTLIDGSQAAPHMPVDVKSIDCDFYAFSGHKMLGPLGIGVLYGKKKLLEKMPPFLTGGDMISKVTFSDAEWNDLPMKFEAGTQDVAAAVGLSTAISYLDRIGMSNIHSWEMELLAYSLEKSVSMRGLTNYSPGKEFATGIFPFNIDNVHPHDVASLLSDDGICIRAGHQCAMPLHTRLGIPGSARASAYVYNSHADIDALFASLAKVQKMFGGR